MEDIIMKSIVDRFWKRIGQTDDGMGGEQYPPSDVPMTQEPDLEAEAAVLAAGIASTIGAPEPQRYDWKGTDDAFWVSKDFGSDIEMAKMALDVLFPYLQSAGATTKQNLERVKASIMRGGYNEASVSFEVPLSSGYAISVDAVLEFGSANLSVSISY